MPCRSVLPPCSLLVGLELRHPVFSLVLGLAEGTVGEPCLSCRQPSQQATFSCIPYLRMLKPQG